jgi:hypothetical protein
VEAGLTKARPVNIALAPAFMNPALVFALQDWDEMPTFAFRGGTFIVLHVIPASGWRFLEKNVLHQ